ncbi:MAG: flagellar hook-associated protein FlgK [Oscillospiraceae bacterium]|jgi:flagellar hook-associated protein 1 FlgK|nr:flagellar hook-associated protein FlgK [Oscillospiraceae bacterium]
MRATFFGLEIGRSGLTVSQIGLDVTGHNVANVDTEGYTRQRIINTAYEPFSALRQLRPVDQALVGAGAHVIALDQIRSAYLDRIYRNEATLSGYYDTRVTGLSYVESLFEGAEQAELSTNLMNLFSAFNTLAANTDDLPQRTIVRETAQALTEDLKGMYERLLNQQQAQNDSVAIITEQINVMAQSLSELNKSIYAYEMNGQKANDLRDKRNLLLDQLSELTEITYEEGPDEKMTVWLGSDPTDPDQMLVSHYTVRTLECGTASNPLAGEFDLYVPVWTDGNGAAWTDSTGTAQTNAASITGGELRSHIDLCAVTTKDNAGIPYFVEQLNNLARALVQEINTIHNAAFTHYNAAGGSHDGVDFFNTIDDATGLPYTDLSEISAKNIRLSDDILADPYNIAASAKPVTQDPSDPNFVDPNDTQQSNNEIALKYYRLLDKPNIALTGGFGTVVTGSGTVVGSFFGYMDSIVTDVATTLDHTKRLNSTQTIQTLNAQNNRLSISGVSIDEEMTNLIKYQHAYAGASRIITTMDEILDKLINSTGRVGL